MKYLFIIFSLFLNVANAQVFWTENFNNGCVAACAGLGYTGINGPWGETITGAQGADPNTWFVSCAENGNAVGACGSPCGANATMHLSAAIGNLFCPNDCGAAYDAGGLCGIFYCPQTNRRIESPVINCTGQVGISLNFNYIENGQGLTDNATVWYFNGLVWAQIDDPPKTLTGCGGQGIWAARTVAMPASANNNAAVKIGFRWVNNDDGVGTDPSFAVDDVTLSAPTLPVTLVSFNAKADDRDIDIDWASFDQKNFDGFFVERSLDGANFTEISFIKGESNRHEKFNYSFEDKEAEGNKLYYYRLKSVDKDRSYNYSEIKTAKIWTYKRDIVSYYDGAKITLVNTEGVSDFTKMELLDLTGKVILSGEISKDKAANEFNAEALNKGIYFLRVGNLSESRTVKVSVW